MRMRGSVVLEPGVEAAEHGDRIWARIAADVVALEGFHK